MNFLHRPVFIALLILTFYGHVTAAHAHSVFSPCEHKQCIAIVDAGSTGSRVNLFSYEIDAQNQLKDIQKIYVNKVQPGIADIDMNTQAINDYLSQLIPYSPQNKIPIYVYATAGMRLRSTDTQDFYYQQVRDWFALNPKWQLIEARTITGHEEGIFGWLALNHYLNLESGDKPFSNLIEIGGASAQIAFPVKDDQFLDAQDIDELMINGHHVSVFAHGFLGLGSNEIGRITQNQSACYPTGYTLQDGRTAVGQADICQSNISTILQKDYHVTELSKQALDKNIGDTWYTVSAVASMASKAPLAFPTNSFTAQELLEQADDKLCHQDYASLQAQYPDDKHIDKNCLIASYFYGLLVHGYVFNPDEVIHYLPEYNSDWTIGVLLHQFMQVKNSI